MSLCLVLVMFPMFSFLYNTKETGEHPKLHLFWKLLPLFSAELAWSSATFLTQIKWPCGLNPSTNKQKKALLNHPLTLVYLKRHNCSSSCFTWCSELQTHLSRCCIVKRVMSSLYIFGLFYSVQPLSWYFTSYPRTGIVQQLRLAILTHQNNTSFYPS